MSQPPLFPINPSRDTQDTHFNTVFPPLYVENKQLILAYSTNTLGLTDNSLFVKTDNKTVTALGSGLQVYYNPETLEETKTGLQVLTDDTTIEKGVDGLQVKVDDLTVQSGLAGIGVRYDDETVTSDAKGVKVKYDEDDFSTNVSGLTVKTDNLTILKNASGVYVPLFAGTMEATVLNGVTVKHDTSTIVTSGSGLNVKVDGKTITVGPSGLVAHGNGTTTHVVQGAVANYPSWTNGLLSVGEGPQSYVLTDDPDATTALVTYTVKPQFFMVPAGVVTTEMYIDIPYANNDLGPLDNVPVGIMWNNGTYQVYNADFQILRIHIGPINIPAVTPNVYTNTLYVNITYRVLHQF